MSIRDLSTLANLTETEVKSLKQEDVMGLSGYLASTITSKQIPWFDPVVLGQFLLGENKSGLYNFSGGNYLKHEVFDMISLDQISTMLHSNKLPFRRELEKYLMIKKLVARQQS